MGNQQSISSNNINENEIKYPNSNIEANTPQIIQKENKNYNVNESKYLENSLSNLADKSELSSSDIMMKETNESIKSIEEVNMRNDNIINLSYLKENNLKSFQNANSNPNINKNAFVKIVWNEGGENVFISGNFVNWNQWFYMNKKEKSFEIVFVILFFPNNIRHFYFSIN